MGMFMYDWGATPGVRAELDTFENAFAWGRKELQLVWGAQIDGTARDSGSTPTTVLRPGLCLGRITATKKWKEYDPASTDGSEIFRGILPFSYRMTDINASNQDKLVAIVVGGPVQASKLYGLDRLARAQARGRFLFDDFDEDLGAAVLPWVHTVAVAADTTVAATDNGKHFVVTGGTGVTFTLPAVARGLAFRFTNAVNQNMTVAAVTADTMITFNDGTATSVAFSTSSNKIGASVEIVANPLGTLWIVLPNGANTMTVS